jgi:hypothetical protein
VWLYSLLVVFAAKIFKSALLVSKSAKSEDFNFISGFNDKGYSEPWLILPTNSRSKDSRSPLN